MEHASIKLSDGTKRVISGHADPASAEQQELLEDFLCPCCKTHICDGMVSTACGHLLHGDCLDRSLKTDPACPSCGTPLPEDAGEKRFGQVNQKEQKMMRRVKVKCPQECSAEPMQHEQLKSHIDEECTETTFRCDGCEALNKRGEALDHAERCDKIILDCEQCGAKIERGDIRSHRVLWCPNRKVSCEHCCQEYTLSDPDAHYLDKCTGYARIRDVVKQGADLREQTAQLAELRDLIGAQGRLLKETTARQQLEMDRREEHARVQLAEQVSRLQQQTQDQTARRGAAVEQQLGELREQTAGLLQRVDEQQEAIEQLERAKALQQRSMEQQKEAIQKQLAEKTAELEQQMTEKTAQLEEKIRDQAAQLKQADDQHRLSMQQQKEAVEKQLAEKTAQLEQQMTAKTAQLEEKIRDQAAQLKQADDQHQRAMQQSDKRLDDQCRALQQQLDAQKSDIAALGQTVNTDQRKLLQQQGDIKDLAEGQKKHAAAGKAALEEGLKKLEDTLGHRLTLAELRTKDLLSSRTADLQKQIKKLEDDFKQHTEKTQGDRKRLEQELQDQLAGDNSTDARVRVRQVINVLLGRTAEGAPLRFRVSSEEKSFLNGEYTLVPLEKHNGHRVWRSAEGEYMFKNVLRCWMVSLNRESMIANKGCLHSAESSAASPVASLYWKCFDGSQWSAAPGTSVEAVAGS